MASSKPPTFVHLACRRLIQYHQTQHDEKRNNNAQTKRSQGGGAAWDQQRHQRDQHAEMNNRLLRRLAHTSQPFNRRLGMKIIALMPKKQALFQRLGLELSRKLIIAVENMIPTNTQSAFRIVILHLPCRPRFVLCGMNKRALVKCHAATIVACCGPIHRAQRAVP
ncbi:MAG: hypothetical protein GPOALKHO_001594 [Sodalis sp.]|nr:MAG: hypothetical protein GPOALKHO_001594 [Sodalis sp.]